MNRLLFVALAGLISSAAFGQVINGGFETGDFTGWTVLHQGGFSGVGGSPGTNNTGNFHLYMGATSATDQTDIYQDIATTIGQSYTVSYWAYDMDPLSSGGFLVTFGGAAIGPGRPAAAYTQYTGNFTATAASTRLEVTGWEANQYINADDFSVSPVPEPASMAILGMGALALLRRRRR